MYAVFKTGGKQFRAQAGERLRVPSIEAEPGDTVTFEDVLLLSDGDDVKVGQPVVEGASVKAEIVLGILAVSVADRGLGLGKAATGVTGIGLT